MCFRSLDDVMRGYQDKHDGKNLEKIFCGLERGFKSPNNFGGFMEKSDERGEPF